ncbi:glycosyltransferase [Candidatus Micrarchaeota archaeon]|nr:glycosyltransferase [Candidatus Micrarchaeota archaeon]
MRIGFFTETYHPQTNGVVTTIDMTGSRLVERGNRVDVFAPRSDRREHLGMHIHSCPAITFRPYPDYKVALPMRMRVPKLDVVHTHGPFSMGMYGLRVAKKQDIPSVTTYHTLLSEYTQYISKHGKKFTSRAARKYCEYHYRKYDSIIALSNAIKNTLPADLQEKCELIPTGIDTDALKPVANARKKLNLDYDRVYLYLGRLGFEKKIDVVIKAADKFVGENEVLLIAGKGPASEKLKKLVRELDAGEKVRFVGYVPEEKKPLYYSAADAFITASDTETLGLVVAEAMACGTPVVGADGMAIPENVRVGKDGFLFKPNDYRGLAKLMKTNEFTPEMRKNARKHALELSIEKTVDKYEELYERLINRK